MRNAIQWGITVYVYDMTNTFIQKIFKRTYKVYLNKAVSKSRKSLGCKFFRPHCGLLKIRKFIRVTLLRYRVNRKPDYVSKEEEKLGLLTVEEGQVQYSIRYSYLLDTEQRCGRPGRYVGAERGSGCVWSYVKLCLHSILLSQRFELTKAP